MQRGQKHETKKVAELDGSPFNIELTIVPDYSFDEILIEAIDEAFSSLGESVKESIYFHFEKLIGVKKQEIPKRIDDFQNALEGIFGLGARYLEILFIKNLQAKVNTVYKCDIPQSIVPELTFQSYIQIVKENFENQAHRTGAKI